MVGDITYYTTGSTWVPCTSGTPSSTAVDYKWADVTCTNSSGWVKVHGSESAVVIERIPSKLPVGKRTLELPDGAKLIIDDAGNYRIEDKDAKVTYAANRNRDFSPHLNASDMLAQFVRYVGSLGVKQAEVLGLPLELFINWLVIEAAERDKDPVPADVVPVADHEAIRLACRPRCLECGRFIPRLHAQRRFMFCDPAHAADHLRALPALKV